MDFAVASKTTFLIFSYNRQRQQIHLIIFYKFRHFDEEKIKIFLYFRIKHKLNIDFT